MYRGWMVEDDWSLYMRKLKWMNGKTVALGVIIMKLKNE